MVMRPPVPSEPSVLAIRWRQLLPHTIFAVILALTGSTTYGAWWYLHRKPDPTVHAAMREGLGDLRETVLLRRNEVAAQPTDPDSRLRFAQVLLRIFDGYGAESAFRVAERLGADHWVVVQGLGEAFTIQGDWRKLLAELPDTAPTPKIAARILLMRATAQIALKRLPAATATLTAARRVTQTQVEPMLIAGRLSLSSGDFGAAQVSIQAALKLEPSNIDALFLEYRLVDDRGDISGALEIVGRILAIAPWSIPARLHRADLLMRSGKDIDASAEVETILSRFPTVPGALFLRAMLLSRGGNDEATVVALEQLGPAIDIFPRALLLEAVLSARLGRPEAAWKLAAQFNAHFPEDRDGVVVLAQNQLATKRADLAVPLLARAVARGKPGAPADAELLTLLGTAYAATGNQAGALRVREAAAAAAPNNPQILASLGLSQLRQGDITEALDTLDQSATRSPPTASLSDALFSAAFGAGDLDRAEAALIRRRTQEGETEAVGTMAALLLLARGDVDAAFTAFQALVANYPDAIVPRVNLANLLIRLGRLPDAEALLKTILSEDPTCEAALDALIPFLISQKRFDEAIRAAEIAEAGAPGNTRFTALRADLLIREGNPKAALALLEDRQQSKKLDRSLIGTLAKTQAASGDTTAALLTYADILRTQPGNTDARFAQVNLLLRANLLGAAETSLRDGLVQTPGLFDILFAMVSLEGRRNGLNAALALADELQTNPGNRPASAFLKGDLLILAAQPSQAAQAYRAEFNASPTKALALRLARAEGIAGHPDTAASILRTWLTTHPDDPDVETAVAQIDLRTGHWDLAQTELEARLRRRPNDTAALNNLAWTYQLKGDPRAYDLAKRSYQLQPSPATADTVGWIMLSQDKIPAAIEILQLAAAQAPEDPTIAYHLASALQRNGQREDGIRVLEPILAGPVGFEDRPAAEQLLQKLKIGG